MKTYIAHKLRVADKRGAVSLDISVPVHLGVTPAASQKILALLQRLLGEVFAVAGVKQAGKPGRPARRTIRDIVELMGDIPARHGAVVRAAAARGIPERTANRLLVRGVAAGAITKTRDGSYAKAQQLQLRPAAA